MTQSSDGAVSGGFKAAVSLLASAWPILAGLVVAFLAYSEVRGDAKIATAIKEHDGQTIARESGFITRVEWEARRSETDRRLDEAAANDRLLNDRLGRIEASINQLTVSVEAIRQRQEDDRRASRGR